MNEIKTAEQILALNTADLRAYAKECGVARAANDTKATLAAKVITKVAEATQEIVEAAVEVVEVTPIVGTPEEIVALLEDVAAAADAPAAPVKNPCSDCGKRSVGTGKDAGHESKAYAKEQKLCMPCANEGQISIAHENGHENISEEQCWYCHPELDDRDAVAPVRTGRSRAGMVIFAKGTYVHKSSLVAEAIKAAGGTSEVKSTKGGEVTTLRGEVEGTEIKMTWTGNAFEYGEDSIINGKQVRNVAAALRVIAGLAAKK